MLISLLAVLLAVLELYTTILERINVKSVQYSGVFGACVKDLRARPVYTKTPNL